MGTLERSGISKREREREGAEEEKKNLEENRQIDGEKKAVFVVAGFVGGASPDGA